MKNKKHYTREESTLLQEIVRTYRYPDGTLNGIAVFISTLALVLLLIFGHFTINGLKHLAGLDKVSASELSLENIEDYITETYLDALDDYTDKKIDHDTAKRRILKQLAAFINSSDAFTDEQKVELIETIKQYLDDITIEELIKNNQESIAKLTTEFNKYQKENEATKELLLNTLETEIRTNKEYTQAQLDALNELHDKLEKLELTHWNSINNMLAETIQRYDHYTNELATISYGGLQVWSAYAKYDIDTYVIYNISSDYDHINYTTGSQNDVRIFKNLTGVNTNTPPSKDKENWQEFSTFGAISNTYNTFLERLYGGIAEWDAAGSYKPNSYVMYKNQLYRNITGVNTDVTPDKDTVNWAASSMITVIQNTYNTFLAATGAKDYVAGEAHSAGEYVIYNNTIYKNVSDNAGAMNGAPIPGVTDGDGTEAVWVAVTITDMIDKNYQTFITTVGAEDYNNEHSYQAGDYVIKDGTLYRATDVTSGSFDASKWEKVTVTDQIDTLRNDLDALAVKSSTDLEAVNENLTDIINKNKSLSDEQRAQMLQIINDNADSSAEGMDKLRSDLTAVINSNDTKNEKEREKLLKQLNALSDNTATHMDDYEKRIKNLEDRTTSLDGSQKFQFDCKNGIQGYSVDGVFYPF